MSHVETNKPLTELCERAWKLLHRLGEKTVDHRLNDTMYFKFERYRLFSRNRFLWISLWDPHYQSKRPIFTVDEEGEVGILDIIECAVAVEKFRKFTILDDLAEISGG